MNTMINHTLVKELRLKRSWSQDQLATIAGISLRTVQRIENDGAASLESKKALASAFEINAADLETDTRAGDLVTANQRGRKLGYAGAVLGLLGAYSGITLDLIGGGMSIGTAGNYYGVVGAMFGICCAAIGNLSRRRSRETALN